MGQYSNDNKGIMHANGDYGVVLFDRADKKFREGWSKESFIRGAFPGVNELTGGSADLPTGAPVAEFGDVNGSGARAVMIYRSGTNKDSEINGKGILISSSDTSNSLSYDGTNITVHITTVGISGAAFKKLCETGPITGSSGASLKVLLSQANTDEGFVLSGVNSATFSGGVDR